MGQCELFQVSPFAYEIANVVTMGDLGHGLMDNGALVKIGGGVVGRGPDQLDTLFVRLVVGLGAGEGGKKGVMDIDNGFAEGIEEDAGQDLHVSSHDDQLDPVLLEEGKLLGFGFRLRFFGYWNVFERNAVLF